ncbi:MAG: eCIS core domain-containing protein [Persicimonas sp.]
MKATNCRGLHPDEQRMILCALLAERVACEPVCRSALADCTLFRRTPRVAEVDDVAGAVAYLALKTRASGVALGSRVFLRREVYGDDGEVGLALLAHELTHVVQFHRDGVARFLWRYVVAYLAGLTRGIGDHQAYLSIPYEVEARRVARRVRQMSPGADSPPHRSRDDY